MGCGHPYPEVRSTPAGDLFVVCRDCSAAVPITTEDLRTMYVDSFGTGRMT